MKFKTTRCEAIQRDLRGLGRQREEGVRTCAWIARAHIRWRRRISIGRADDPAVIWARQHPDLAQKTKVETV